MSYLPRMSETYREPRSTSADRNLETIESTVTFNNLKPASAILSEKSLKTQLALRHYRYLPHSPPTLPGPSMLDEALENESLMEKLKSKRGSSLSKSDSIEQSQMNVIQNVSENSNLEESEDEKDELKRENTFSSTKRSQLRKANKSSKSVNKKKMASKSSLHKKQSSKKLDNVTVNMCLVGFELPKDFTVSSTDKKNEASEELENLEKASTESLDPMQTLKQTLMEVDKLKARRKDLVNRSVQCTIFGSSEKVFVIPQVINSLLQALAFLLHELNREDAMTQGSNDKKRLMPQIQLILGDLCNQKCEDCYGFDTTFSDSKRVEKILYDLQKYIKDVYGAKEEQVDKMEDLKRTYMDLKKKELELGILEDKIKEVENPMLNALEIKESDFKNPEVTLQNKRLESEQLLAEIEFSSREMINFQKILAEKEWEIKLKQDEVAELKKLRLSKSKTEVSGKKTPNQKYSGEMSTRSCKSRESSERSTRRKT